MPNTCGFISTRMVDFLPEICRTGCIPLLSSHDRYTSGQRNSERLASLKCLPMRPTRLAILHSTRGKVATNVPVTTPRLELRGLSEMEAPVARRTQTTECEWRITECRENKESSPESNRAATNRKWAPTTSDCRSATNKKTKKQSRSEPLTHKQRRSGKYLRALLFIVTAH